MVLRLRAFEWFGWRRKSVVSMEETEIAVPKRSPAIPAPELDIAPNDPLLAYFASVNGSVNIDTLELDSPALAAMRSSGIKLVVPLVSQGELIGLLNLGQRLSEQEYSTDDRRLLDNLASQAAPAIRVAQLVQEQQAEARELERIEQEMRVAQLIQQQFLPKELPNQPGWQLAAHYQPARAVGGDFYDAFEVQEGLVAIIVGDVADKGIPAAMVMASTRSLLRAEAPRLISPNKVLARVNDLLFPSTPTHMYVTCFYAVLDPRTGCLQFANAGHNLPYVRTAEGVSEVRATGMPLGLMPDMTYEEKEFTLRPDESLLIYSDGLTEAHSPAGDMFGFPRVKELMREPLSTQESIDLLMTELRRFTGPGVEQADDITLLALHRSPNPADRYLSSSNTEESSKQLGPEAFVLADFTVASEPGNERFAMDQVVAVLSPLQLSQSIVDRIKTAVSEATMNAIEHGNRNQPDLLVEIRVVIRESKLSIAISDQGGDTQVPVYEAPDIDLKLLGLQSPRGWGLFLIENMVDEMRQTSDGTHYTVELIIYLKGNHDADTGV